jgi:hypothetical protein
MTAGQLVLACGQTFNKRYDPFAQAYAQVAWGLDPNGADGYSISVATYYSDSVYLYITAALIRLNGDGAVLSESKMLGGMNSIYPGWANCSERTRDGGIIIGGSIYQPNDISNAALIRYGPTGDSLWLREYGDVVHTWIGRQATAVKDRGLMLCGETNSSGVLDAFLIKTDSMGNEEWRRTYGEANWRDYIVSVDTTMDDGYFTGGEYRIAANNLQLWVQRLDVDGDTLWSRIWGSAYDEPNAHLTTKANGNPLVASGWGYAPQFGLARCYMAELDQSDGSIVWDREYGPLVNTTTLLTGKEVSPGGGHIAAGFTFEPNTNFFKGVMLRTADNGDSLWMRNYFYYDSLMTDGMGEFKDVIPTPDGGFIACGYTQGSYTGPYPPGYNQDVWVVKVDSLGCIEPGCNIPLGITSQITNLTDALRVWPNPVVSGGEVTVQVTLPEGLRKEALRVSVVSSDGKLVVEQSIPPQTLTFTLRTSNYASGLYHLHLTSGSTWVGGTRFVVE